MLDMQQKRAANPKRSKSKYLPKPKVNPDDAWPSFWNQECEDAFLTLKRLVISAVELNVPDFEGSMNGTNIFHLWPDACQYGIGAGLFQGSRIGSTETMTAYAILGLQNWVTKSDIEKRFQQLRKNLAARNDTSEELERIRVAYDQLIDVEKRKQYDEELGLSAKRKSRVDMRPLGFYSKSLSKAQQKWPTWERELLAALLALVHFRSIVAGAVVEIHTDHLNNTVVNQALSNPDKILRMLLKVDSLVLPRWSFAPGRGQFGDGLSRNPPDRDSVREQSELRLGAPKTLGEAFAAVANTTLEGSDLIDDCEQHISDRVMVCATSESVNADSGGGLSSETVNAGAEETFDLDLPEVMRRVLERELPVRAGVVQCPTSESHPLPCVLVPSFVEELSELDKLDGYRVLGKGIELKSEVTMQPQVLTTRMGRRWLEAYTPPPRNKQTCRRFRLTVLDGVLAVVRMLRDSGLANVVGIGEGSVVCMCALSSDLRKSAYKDRHVNEGEQLELEAAISRLEHVVLISPLTFPVKSYMPLLREYVPEIVCVIPPEACSVLVVVPVRDACSSVGNECAGWILGALTETIEFGGPAYRTVPASPLALYQLHLNNNTVGLVHESPTKPPTAVAEAWAGGAGMSQQCIRVGFTARAYECSPDGPKSYLPEGDIEREENQTELAEMISSRKLYNLHVGITCTSWTPFQNANKTTRTMDLPQGDGSLEHERVGNQSMAVALWLVVLCISHGVFFSMEHPKPSRCWHLPLLIFILGLVGVYIIDLDQCAWCKRPGDWDPTQGDIRTRKSTRIITNNPYLRTLEKRCADVVAHSHRAVEGLSGTGIPRSVESGAYAEAMTLTYAQGLRTAWTHGARPDPINLDPVLLKTLQDNIAFSPKLAEGVRERVLRESPEPVNAVSGGALQSSSSSSPVPVNAGPGVEQASSSSSGANLPGAALIAAGAPQSKKSDYWNETSTTWIRMHVVPRNLCFTPGDSLDGPKDDTLQPMRVTEQAYVNGSQDTKSHNWTDPHQSHCKSRTKWTGRSIFYKKESPDVVPDAATVPNTGTEVKPNTPDGLRAGLAGMRTQLRQAQAKDPRLVQIISSLKKMNKGSYLAEPRGPDSHKVKVRAYEYRLASDGLLVARENLGEVCDRPVIPDVQHESPTAPRNMTWKHLILGSMHNTISGAHRRPEEMHHELSRLVAWWPPEELLKACKLWRDRCKLCTSVHGRPREEARYQAVKSCRPFYRLQFDLLEIKPSGENGERYLLTSVCVATRYPFIRATTTRDASVLALLLLDIVLDMGVVPAVFQSDNEFVSLAFEELCTLLGATQLFSTALRPQSQGIVERSHLDMRAALAILVDSFIRACPRKWPQYVRYLESKIRHKKLPTGVSPYAAVHGFAGSTALGSALGAIEAIPEDLIHSDWLQSIVSECKAIGESLTAHWSHEAEVRARKHSEKKPEAHFCEQDLVLIRKPFFERGTRSILPQCDGPFSISRLPTAHTAVLEDPLTGNLFLDGRPVSVARLIRFNFPAAWSGPEAVELSEQVGDLSGLRPGDMVAVEPRISQNKRVFIARVERAFYAQALVQVTLFHVPTSARFGPWQRRPWEVWQENGRDHSEMLTASEVICKVALKHGALDLDSLERLAGHGIATGSQPSRDSTLPPRSSVS